MAINIIYGIKMNYSLLVKKNYVLDDNVKAGKMIYLVLIAEIDSNIILKNNFFRRNIK